MSKISIILPVYNEEECIKQSYERLIKATAPIEKDGHELEYVFVNDGSKDKSAEILTELGEKDKRVRLLNFSRNFGHQIAITAGLDYATGDAIAVIDADMQDPPELICDMVKKWEEGYDVVYGKRKKRDGETFFKKVTAKMYYKILASLTSINLPRDVGDFRLLSKEVAEHMRGLKEHNRYVRGLVVWVGFKQTSIEFEREARLAGETKYPLKKMLKLAMDGILSFSYAPLKLLLHFGTFLCIIGVLASVSLFFWNAPPLFSFSSIGLIFTGILLFGMGIIGEYIARINDDTRNRPLYIIKK